MAKNHAPRYGADRVDTPLGRPIHLVTSLASRSGGSIGSSSKPGHGTFESKTILTRWGEIGLGATMTQLAEVDCGDSLIDAIDEESSAHRCVLGVKSHGLGTLIIGSQAALMTDAAYGEKYSNLPTEKQRLLFEFQYELFDCILQQYAPGAQQ